jgi:hypothetical protein
VHSLCDAHHWCKKFLTCAILVFGRIWRGLANGLIQGEISVVLVLFITLCSLSVRKAGLCGAFVPSNCPKAMCRRAIEQKFPNKTGQNSK